MKVLIIDPNKQTRQIHTEILQDAGIETVGTNNLRTAFHILKTMKCNVILTEVFSELIDSISLFGKMTKSKILLLTNTCEERVISETMRYGVSGYIIKSRVSADEFVRLIRLSVV
jgi:DNA-binding NarL/FixJ family response regulator